MRKRMRTVLLAASLLISLLLPMVAHAGEHVLAFVNNSQHSGVVIVYQHPPNTATERAFAVAWQALSVAPASRAIFHWSTDYSVALGQSGNVAVGSHFVPRTTLRVDLVAGVQVTVNPSAGTLQITEQGGVEAGALNVSVLQDSTVDRSAVAVRIDGKPSLVVSTPPGVRWTYRPSSTYYVAFGHFMEGMILNTSLIPQSIAVQLEEGADEATVMLVPDGRLSIEGNI